jgi:inhibitor of KinA
MIGFLPGFPYLGTLDEKLSVPRKSQPQIVAAGSVAIAGKQTGIYPLTSPGGWNVIGRTPLKLFDPYREDPTLLNAGDVVEFYPIGKNEFLNLLA